MIARTGIFAASLALAACSSKEQPPAPPPPPSAPAASPSQVPAPTADAQAFTGEVRLGEGIGADQVKPTDVLFVMARECAADCTQPGRLVAVERVPSPTFPRAYSIGGPQVMVQGTPFVGPFVVQARLDRDGDPMTKGGDDLYAQVTTGVKPGQKDVALVLGREPSTPPVAPAAAPPVHGGAGAVPPGHGAGGAMPPGHGAGGAMPPGHGAAGALPPGHPPTTPGATPSPGAHSGAAH